MPNNEPKTMIASAYGVIGEKNEEGKLVNTIDPEPTKERPR